MNNNNDSMTDAEKRNAEMKEQIFVGLFGLSSTGFLLDAKMLDLIINGSLIGAVLDTIAWKHDITAYKVLKRLRGIALHGIMDNIDFEIANAVLGDKTDEDIRNAILYLTSLVRMPKSKKRDFY